MELDRLDAVRVVLDHVLCKGCAPCPEMIADLAGLLAIAERFLQLASDLKGVPVP